MKASSARVHSLRETPIAEAAFPIEAREESGSIAVWRGDAWLCRARIRTQALAATDAWAGGTALILDEFESASPAVLRSESDGALPVLRLLFRAATTNPQRSWHVLRIDARIDQAVVIGAAWRYALEREMACEAAWVADDVVAVRIFGHGARSALARLSSHVSVVGKLTTRLRSRIRLVRPRRRVPRPGDSLLFVLDLEKTIPGTRATDISFRSVDLATVSRRPLLFADTVRDAEVPLEGGERCFVGEVDGRIVFRMWVGAVEPEWLVGVDPAIAGRQSRYLHDSHTMAEYRNRGIRSAALRWLAPRLRDEGYEMLWLHVMPDNPAAIRSAGNVGFRRVDRVTAGNAGALSGNPGVVEQIRSLKLSGPGVLEVVREMISETGTVRVRAAGTSMWPMIPDGAIVTLVRLEGPVRPGQIVLMDWGGVPVLHRVLRAVEGAVYTMGDSCLDPDPPTDLPAVLALATAVADRRGVITLVGSWSHGIRSWFVYLGGRGRLALARRWRGLRRSLHPAG